MTSEETYIRKRMWSAGIQSIPFYLCRIFPIKRKKIVFCCIEGTTGYSCNPKYIAEELIRRNEGYELVWLVNDTTKKFPKEIHAVHNTLWNRAYHLSTARFWIDNSRKQLEARKRKGQTYIQTWHAKLTIKPTGLDRGAAFPKIAYLVSKHDSDMVDCVLSNSDWFDRMAPTAILYNGPMLRTGSPRCDILVNGVAEARKRIRQSYGLEEDANILMYAPTFRGGSQGTVRTIAPNQGAPDYARLVRALESRFGGKWYVFLRLHPQLVARGLDQNRSEGAVIDVSRADDMYELLAGCDAYVTDYSCTAFEAAVMRIPVFLYADDYAEYEQERGKLLWDLRQMPFPLATNDEELDENVRKFEEEKYQLDLDKLFSETGMAEDGKATKRVADFIAAGGEIQ